MTVRMPRCIRPLMVASLAVWFGASAQDGGPVRFESGERPPLLIELFTSQGCSSCPPADRWLSRFADNPGLWKQVVPVAFHVDYWDRLGWKDPFASRKHTLRQRRYKEAGRTRSVYTPGFVVNGSEWRGWFSGQALPDRPDAAGVLSAELESGRLRARYPGGSEALALQVAVLGFGFETPVAGGENRNKTLKHDFVVLWHERRISETGRWSVDLPGSLNPDAERYGLALWVTPANDPAPLQAAGGWLPGWPNT